MWVTDQDDPQIESSGEVGEPPQVRCRDHACFVDDHCCPALQPPLRSRPALTGMFMQQLREGVRTPPVSVSRTRAAFAVGAIPNAGRPCAWRSSTAAVSVLVLPAPAGPMITTNRSSPATSAAAAAWSTSRWPRTIDCDGDGSGSWAATTASTTAALTPTCPANHQLDRISHHTTGRARASAVKTRSGPRRERRNRPSKVSTVRIPHRTSGRRAAGFGDSSAPAPPRPSDSSDGGLTPSWCRFVPRCPASSHSVPSRRVYLVCTWE